MTAIRMADNVRNLFLDQIIVAIDAGRSPGTVKFYTGDQPPSANDAITDQILLATLTFSLPSAPFVSGGMLAFSPITEDSEAKGTGVVTWARIEDSVGSTVFDCDVTEPGRGGTIEMNTVKIVVGGPVRISAFSLIIPAG